LILMRRLMAGSDSTQPFALGFDAIQRMFRIDPAELQLAEKLLISAHDQDPRGIFLAWRAYLRTFLTAEHRIDIAAQGDEARMLVRKALELDPHNSYVLALCSYVHSLLFAEFQAGHELAEQSVRYNPGNPLGVAYLGRAKTYLGDFEGGYELATRARALAGPSPYRYTLDFLGGVSAALSGRFTEAIWLEELSRSLSPNYRAPLRYLLALYLKTGERTRAREVFDTLRRNEPEFSMRLMRDRSYPTDGLRAVGLLDCLDPEFE
jgi:tetratricopeptide (TPR) repeat protein